MSSTKLAPPKLVKNRPNDYLYDPLFTFSSRRDFEKTAMKSLMSCMEARVRPHFLSMFSELIQFPNADLALIKGSDRVPCFMERSWDCKKKDIQPKKNQVDIRGRSMTLYIARPAPISKTFKEIYPHTITLLPPPEKATKFEEKRKRGPKMKAAATQSMYRESSAQTSPWQPPYQVIQTGEEAHHPELLTLGALSWGAGLPAGVYECKMIERARMRRAWERSLIPVKDKAALDKLVDALEKIERSEWAFREKELNRISRVRMELMLKVLEDTYTTLSERSMKKLQNYWIMKKAEKERKICQLKWKSNRELRKLERKHKKLATKYKPHSIVDDHLEFSSEIYAPLVRHGEDPKRAHFCCCSDEFIPEFKDVEELNVIPPWLNNFEKYDPDHLTKKKEQSRKLCVRATKWTIENLGKLQQTMAEMRLRMPKQRLSLSKYEIEESSHEEPPTPTVEPVPDHIEANHQAALFLQKVIQGRAVQSIIYEGRDRNHELIEEIKTTHALLDADMNMKNLDRVNILMQQRARAIQNRSTEKIDEMLKSLEGNTLGAMLDYLNKELLRLQDERKAHAFALIALRERWKREAAEGGRRQKEERRRREHDEMFKQIVKINQETVDLYLQDIVMDGLKNTAEEDAKKYVKQIAEMIDGAVEKAVKHSDYLQQEEIAADLIHNFVIPEVEKQIMRENMRKKQHKYLLAAHEAIYDEIQAVGYTKHDEAEIKRRLLEAQKHLPKGQELEAADEEKIIANIVQSFEDALVKAGKRYEQSEEGPAVEVAQEMLVDEHGKETIETLRKEGKTE